MWCSIQSEPYTQYDYEDNAEDLDCGEACDKFMIWCMDWEIFHVQHMPAKPIKHSIKVFTLCCTFLAVILLFKVYIGKEDALYGTVIGVCIDLVGQLLFFYFCQVGRTNVQEVWIVHRWHNIFYRYKISREKKDTPFLKLANGTRLGVKCGF